MISLDPTTQSLVQAARASATAGNVITPMANAVVNSIGADYNVRLKVGTTVYLSLQMSGSISIINKQLVIPNNGAVLEQLQNMAAELPGSYCLICNDAETRFIRGTLGASGADFNLTGPLQITDGIAIGSLVMYFSPALDQVNTVSGTINLAVVGDSYAKGGAQIGGVAEADYMSIRSPVRSGLIAAGYAVSMKGVSGFSNPLRGSSDTSTYATAAQGGIRLTVPDGNGLSISVMLDRLKSENQVSSYADWVILIVGGLNDGWAAGATGGAIAADYQTVINKAQSLFPGALIATTGVPTTLVQSASLTEPTATLLSGMDTGGKVLHINLRTAASWTANDFTSNYHWSDAGAAKAGNVITPAIVNRIKAPTQSINELILQSQAHEVMPFVANPGQLYTQRPFVIFEQTGGNFSLQGRYLMPSWFNPSNKAQLLDQWFVDIHPWWVACNIRNSSGGNANASNAAIRIYGLEFIVWRGGNNYDAPIRAGTSWVGSYAHDFTTFASGAEWRNVSDGSVICRPTYDGTRVPHGGGAGIGNIANPSTVRGVILSVEHQLVDWNTGNPIADASARRAVYCGADALPRGGSANSSFPPLNYAPGLGSGSFVEVRNVRRKSRFTTMTAAQLQGNPPPGF